MAIHCIAHEYYDALLQSCQSCLLRCMKPPPLPCRSYCAAMQGGAGPGTEPTNDSNWILWFFLALGCVLTPTIFLLTLVLRKQWKKSRNNTEAGDSLTEAGVEPKNTCGKAVLESNASTDIIRQQTSQRNAEVKDCVCQVCDQPLSDYLFPLPAVEEGAAILVTTKTSAFCNRGTGVRASVEI
ncbi:hypothetical protein FKM82_002775 [Ascaphus truei]